MGISAGLMGSVQQTAQAKAAVLALRGALQGLAPDCGVATVSWRRGMLRFCVLGERSPLLELDTLVDAALVAGGVGGSALYLLDGGDEAGIVLSEALETRGAAPTAAECRRAFGRLLRKVLVETEPPPEDVTCTRCGATVPLDTVFATPAGLHCEPCLRARQRDLDGLAR